MDMIKLISELRVKTGAGMMDCKKALEASNGNLEEAVVWLRKKGLADAAKRAARATKEGRIAFERDGKAGALVELNSETDFVAKTPEFAELAKSLAAKAAKGEVTCQGCAVPFIEPLQAKLKENMGLRRVERFVPSGPALVAGYIHHDAKKGAMIEIEAPSDAAAGSEALETLANELLLQVVGSGAKYLDRASVPQADVDREREIHAEVVRKEGKPEAAVPKIVEGKLNKLFFQAHCLMEQMTLKDGKVAVAGLVKEASAKVGGEVSVRRFVRYTLGE
ncbi:MAG: translation elongation factor Ts [Elusimicrobia bacterium]|nr:translation elongation factor Ts [Elusimicrobiota bacterium]